MSNISDQKDTIDQNQSPIQRDKHGHRLSKFGGVLPSRRSLHRKISLLKNRLKRLENQLQEHLEV